MVELAPAGGDLGEGSEHSARRIAGAEARAELGVVELAPVGDAAARERHFLVDRAIDETSDARA